MNIKKILVVILALALIFSLGACDKEKSAAKKDFKAAVEQANTANDKLDEAVSNAQDLLENHGKPLDKTTVSNLKKQIAVTKKAKIKIPDQPSETEDIKAATKKLTAADNSGQVKALKKSQKALTDSVKQLKLLNKPSEKFVVSRLKNAKYVNKVVAATEDNDPNGQLHKAGGYTAAVFFQSSLVDQSDVYGSSLIDKGTDAGGCIEVYGTAADAKERNEYLSAFDGGILSSGGHKVLGTVVIRTSCELTASKQKALEKQVIAALTKLN